MRIAIVGSRDFNDYNVMEAFVLSDLKDIQAVVSGGAKGADSLASEFARKNNLNMIEFLPEWEKYGRGAGAVRNQKIIRNADVVFAFWDGTKQEMWELEMELDALKYVGNPSMTSEKTLKQFQKYASIQKRKRNFKKSI